MTQLEIKQQRSTRALLHAQRAAGIIAPEPFPNDVFVDIVDYTESELTLALTCLGFADAKARVRNARRAGALARTACNVARKLEHRLERTQAATL